MTFKLGDYFPRKAVNEPFLILDDPRWSELEGGYKGSLYDASIALKQLEQAKTTSEVAIIYKELWNELHHQGNVGVASYYAVPHLVRIAKQSGLIDYNVLGLVSIIEIQRFKNNPKLPGKLLSAFSDAIQDLQSLAELVLKQSDNSDSVVTALSAIAVAKGKLKLGDAISKLDDGVIDELLENYG